MALIFLKQCVEIHFKADCSISYNQTQQETHDRIFLRTYPGLSTSKHSLESFAPGYFTSLISIFFFVANVSAMQKTISASCCIRMWLYDVAIQLTYTW